MPNYYFPFQATTCNWFKQTLAKFGPETIFSHFDEESVVQIFFRIWSTYFRPHTYRRVKGRLIQTYDNKTTRMISRKRDKLGESRSAFFSIKKDKKVNCFASYLIISRQQKLMVDNIWRRIRSSLANYIGGHWEYMGTNSSHSSMLLQNKKRIMPMSTTK